MLGYNCTVIKLNSNDLYLKGVRQESVSTGRYDLTKVLHTQSMLLAVCITPLYADAYVHFAIICCFCLSPSGKRFECRVLITAAAFK